MFLASKIALGYLGYLSIKNKNTKESSKKPSKKDNIDKNDYDTTINEILQKNATNDFPSIASSKALKSCGS
jgi:hypothetical protein